MASIANNSTIEIKSNDIIQLILQYLKENSKYLSYSRIRKIILSFATIIWYHPKPAQSKIICIGIQSQKLDFCDDPTFATYVVSIVSFLFIKGSSFLPMNSFVTL